MIEVLPRIFGRRHQGYLTSSRLGNVSNRVTWGEFCTPAGLLRGLDASSKRGERDLIVTRKSNVSPEDGTYGNRLEIPGNLVGCPSNTNELKSWG
jgi:hypothetical protein